MEPQNYTDAETLLTGRCKDRRKIANNTYLERRESGDIAVKLHNTDVVIYRSNGDVVLTSGGWRTPTTKERIQRFSPIKWLSQSKGIWTVTLNNGESVGFDDNMVIKSNGAVSGGLSEAEVDGNHKEVERIKRKIRKFVNAITPEQVVQAFENTGGDCFLCRFDTGGCEAEHVEEGYFHATLMLRAIKARGYNNPDFIMSLIYNAAQRGGVDSHFMKDTLARFLRKQMLQGMAAV